jgi:AAA+ superfamily predicted ATPase
MKPKARVRLNRFKFFVYTESLFPVCTMTDETRVKRLRDRRMTAVLPGDHIWVPGKYILYVNDSFDESLMRIDFTLDDAMRLTTLPPQMLQPYCEEHVLVTCIEGVDNDWQPVAEMPGLAQFRKRVMHSRQLVLFNEFRKECGMGEMMSNLNLLICTHNDDITPELLRHFLRMLSYEHSFTYIDCSTLYDPTSQYPYEQLTNILSSDSRQVYCLTHLGELLGANGKVIMRRIMEKFRPSDTTDNLWLCGTRQEVDAILEQFPSLKPYFEKGSYIEQEPYSSFDLVQTFFRELARENLYSTKELKDRLSWAVIQGSKQGAVANWALSDVRRFIADEVRPRYLQRALPLMSNNEVTLLSVEDVPFERLTDTASTFQESIHELNEMIGLDEVKQGVTTMANQARFFQERRRRGLKAGSQMVFHSIFTGNPGTGKTTVARKLGKIYRSLGLLSKGEVIAVDRTRIVGQYIGQTEENMKVLLEEARGNVLFIDEAYTLNTGGEDKKDFGGRVIDSLLTVLTQPNPDMLIVLAGYAKEMDAMLNTNPGLAGRFPYRYQFSDYNAEQLVAIARHLLQADDYVLTAEADATLQEVIADALSQTIPNFSNARWVEQLVRNGIIPAMANRIFATACDDLQRIEASDVREGYQRLRPQTITQKSARHRVAGFRA